MCSQDLKSFLLDFADEVLVAQLPGSILSPVGKRLVNETDRASQAQFRALESRFPIGQVERFAVREIPLIRDDADEISTSQRDGVQRIIEPSINRGERGWVAALAPFSGLAFLHGARRQDLSLASRSPLPAAGTTRAAISRVPRTIQVLGARRMETMAKGFNATTLRELTGTIERAMLDGRTKGVGEVGRAIRAKFPDMTVARSRLIATTEMNFAMSRGALDRALNLGATTKQWITVGDDRVDQVVCQPNEAGSGSGIKITSVFESGHMTTPGHPRCRCSVATFGAKRSDVTKGLTPSSTADWLAGLAPLALLPRTGAEVEMLPVGVGA